MALGPLSRFAAVGVGTSDGCEVLHHQKDGWNPHGDGMFTTQLVQAIDDRPKEVRVIAAGGQEPALNYPFFRDGF